MDQKPTITINPAKTSELEFEVTVQGIDDDKPIVRFVIDELCSGGDVSFKCTHVADDTWKAALPVLTTDASSAAFRVEVIIDGYYFEPADGTINFVKAPDVQFSKKEKSKPTVKTSFVVKQDDEPAPKKAVKEASDDPTNALLVPERDPTFSDELGTQPTGKKQSHDKAVDVDDIASSITAGPSEIEGASEVKQPPKLERPSKPGSLFKRASNGKALVPGLEDPETKAKLDAKAAKVRDILSTGE